jgi:Ca2+-binding RTX toxin-like protein
MTDGPGRFALGFQFRFVNNFFARDEEGNYIFDIPVGTYDQTDGPNGITQYVDWAGQPRHIGFSNWQYDDGRGDYGSRTYIWGTVAFDIVNSAQFVVTASGERYIDNYVVRPFLNEGAIENFDFTAGDWAGAAGGQELSYNIDPSGIGRRVDLAFTGSLLPAVRYTETQFQEERALASTWTVYHVWPIDRLRSEMSEIQRQLWDDGTIKYLDAENKVIIYGTQEADSLTWAWLREHPHLGPSIPNGVHIIAGQGGDDLLGGPHDDRLEGNEGNDTLFGLQGSDFIDGGWREHIDPANDGIDTADYVHSSAPVLIDLNGQDAQRLNDRLIDVADDGYGTQDTLHSIEILKLSPKADTFRLGQNTPMSIGGLQQVDFGGEAGGLDILDFSQYGQSLTIANGMPAAFGTQFRNFEAIIGTAFADTMQGGASDDKFKAGVGEDTLKGSPGHDYLDGGLGTDTAVFEDPRDFIMLSSGGTAPTGLEPDQGDSAPYFTVTRTGGEAVLHSVERVRLSEQPDTLILAANIDLTGIEEVDAAGQSGPQGKDTLDLRQLGFSVNYNHAEGTLEGFDTQFKGFERVLGTSRRDRAQLGGSSSAITFDGGEEKDTVDYSDSSVKLTIDLTEMDQQTFETDGLRIIRPVQVASGGGNPPLPEDNLLNIEELKLSPKADKLLVGEDALELDLTIDMGDSDYQANPQANLDVYDLSAVDQSITYAYGRVALGAQTSISGFLAARENLIVKNADKVILTSHDDIVMGAAEATTIETGDGADRI